MDPQVARIEHLILEAEASGALRCAPRELAVARSHLQFAQLERTQGFSSKAEQHLRIADQQAQAARLLSPPKHCQARGDGTSRRTNPLKQGPRGRLAAHVELPQSEAKW